MGPFVQLLMALIVILSPGLDHCLGCLSSNDIPGAVLKRTKLAGESSPDTSTSNSLAPVNSEVSVLQRRNNKGNGTTITKKSRDACLFFGRGAQHRQALDRPVRGGPICSAPGETSGPLQQVCQRVVGNSSTASDRLAVEDRQVAHGFHGGEHDVAINSPGFTDVNFTQENFCWVFPVIVFFRHSIPLIIGPARENEPAPPERVHAKNVNLPGLLISL